MKQKQLFIFLLFILICLCFTACGPSPEEIATQTASAWTATPIDTATPEPTLTFTPTATATFTPTATPIPYDVEIQLSDSEGVPIPGAWILLNEDKVETDEMGMIPLNNLPGETILFSAHGQGYFASEINKTIQRGPNSIEVILERDPFGLLPSGACTENENLLFIEDYQDQAIQGFDELAARIESGAPGIAIEEDPDEAGNWVLVSSSLGENSHTTVMNSNEVYDNAVLRFWTKNNSNQHYHIGWKNDTEGKDARYIAFIYAEQSGGRLDKFMEGVNFTAFNISGSFIGDGNWHLIEISTFDGELQIWIDGVNRGQWLDEKPLGVGQFFLDHDYWTADAISIYNNISVCELTSPFTTTYNTE
ncbi:MAG: hypothetical protein JEZ06_04040 [Anaerolineaceae bacterium]|nr:hypothetical protein [Anaerolineaceae bacterium]